MTARLVKEMTVAGITRYAVSVRRPIELRARLVLIPVRAAFFALRTWLVMLIVGALHHEVSTSIPPLGFWHVTLVLLLVNLLLTSPVAAAVRSAIQDEL